MSYAPPIDDMRFALEAVAGIDRLREIGTESVDAETIGQILDEAGKLARDRIPPGAKAALGGQPATSAIRRLVGAVDDLAAGR